MEKKYKNGISIQVSLSGFSFKTQQDGESFSSSWLAADRLFTTPEFQKKYENVEISLLTPKCALVPTQFFDPSSPRKSIEDVAYVRDNDFVEYLHLPSIGAVMVYSNSIDESLSKVISQTVLTSDGNPVKALPELYYLISELWEIEEYNKIYASYMDGYLYLVIAQGKNLMLANIFEAADFTTAEYFIFLALKKLQLNPEISSIKFRTPLEHEQKMSLYRYFKSVEAR